MLPQQQAYEEIYRYIEFFYNHKRIHGSLGYMSPARFAAQFDKRKKSKLVSTFLTEVQTAWLAVRYITLSPS
ncbi:IS3 family transposase [Paenibacillus aestuarii]|uniref:IS3 family transposase n=1 Tax=Paenibacillus aestuarii TaxID=516965 RepID=A0ABW0KI37_9BACL